MAAIDGYMKLSDAGKRSFTAARCLAGQQQEGVCSATVSIPACAQPLASRIFLLQHTPSI